MLTTERICPFLKRSGGKILKLDEQDERAHEQQEYGESVAKLCLIDVGGEFPPPKTSCNAYRDKDQGGGDQLIQGEGWGGASKRLLQTGELKKKPAR